MANTSLFNKIMALSPYIEVLIRHLYWKNSDRISVLKRAFNKKAKREQKIGFKSDFSKVLQFIQDNGVGIGSLMVVHSAYGELKSTGMKPDAIIDKLLECIGDTGTLAMPAMPKFENDVQGEEYLNRDISDILFEYDVEKSRIKTGVLPHILFSRQGSLRSRFPINTMTAYGPLAAPMMEKNLDDDNQLPCGKGSSWSFCAENDAIIVGLGVDLTHSLTMIHVAEDVLDERWPIKNWYRMKKFSIRDGAFYKELTLRERQPRWGTLHFAERTLCKDLINEGILKATVIDGIIVEVMKAAELLQYLNSRNKNGYPYFGVKKYIAK